MRATCASGPLDVLLLGDSITERWLRPGLASDDSNFTAMEYTVAEKQRDGGDLLAAFGPQRRVAVAAIGGDKTTDMLWRLRAGGLGEAVKQCAPRAVHVLLGTNDLGTGAAPAEAGESYRQLVGELLGLRPDARLTLQLIMPRGFRGIGERRAPKPQGLTSLRWAACPSAGSLHPREIDPDSDPACAVLFWPVSELNRMIGRLASEHGAAGHDVGALDCTSFLIKPKGKVRSFEFPDLVHPNREGYNRWSECLRSAYQ